MQARHSALVVVSTRRVTVTARVVAAVITLCVVTFAIPSGANAAVDVEVSTDPTGAHVRLGRHGTYWEVSAPDAGGGGSAGGPPPCRRWVPTKYPNYLPRSHVPSDIDVTPMPAAPGPDYVAYHVYCGATYITSVWLQPSAFGTAPVVDTREIAQELVRDLPYPAVTVGVSPDGRGLTGLESWFWVSGYSGPVEDAVDSFGYHVEVQAWPAAVRWSFGDGTAHTGSLGQAAPARSDVVHTYEQRSRGGPMNVQASVRLDVRYRVNGGAWEALDPVARSATRAYPVAESRAALVSPH